MGNKAYIGNLAFGLNSDDIQDIFSDCGNIEDVKLITDRDTGRSRGFAFVEFSDSDGLQQAIDRYNGTEIEGRKIVVTEARPEQRGGGGGGGRGGHRGGGGGGHRGGGRGRDGGGGGHRGGGRGGDRY